MEKIMKVYFYICIVFFIILVSCGTSKYEYEIVDINNYSTDIEIFVKKIGENNELYFINSPKKDTLISCSKIKIGDTIKMKLVKRVEFKIPQQYKGKMYTPDSIHNGIKVNMSYTSNQFLDFYFLENCND